MSSLAIKTDNLVKVFGEKRAVDGLNLSIGKGMIYGFLGPNGCGKTTTLRMLCGVLSPSEGEIALLGESVTPYPMKIRSKIGYMSQNFSLYNELSVIENLNFYALLYGLEGKEKKRRIEDLIEVTKLTEYRNTLARNLSGGWRQRLALAVAIIHQPEVLFLDEPTSGVDPVSARLFWDIVYELAAEGVSIVVSTHSMDEAEHCDKVGFLDKGHLLQEGSPAELRKAFPAKMVSIRTDKPMQLSHELSERFGSQMHSYIFGNEVRIRLENDDEQMLKEYEYRRVEPTLEDIFVYMTEHNSVA
ncbi:ABC transporter ATP-binding protein [Sulfurovum sp. zt1-1]|uniref:ABC transporter ATP-binding protein n=1 Tax=Sulfurovum zhangzhouensis TaxID=3019067 RepID=A0ABT7QW39_9BACT|nr:ABC transporter ATP-binding protein [Sulfurovum zhangzhouensis]MDM5271049.1 ABC transporter ATP-binding protein [Sulfurovum zhangzhouensis]